MSGPVAQQGSERRPAEPKVAGSSPAGPALLLIFLIMPLAQVGAQQSFDAVVVRGDIYTDWIIAMSYGMSHGSWIVQLTSTNENEVLKLITGLAGFKRNISILIVGAPNAVPIDFEGKLQSLGIIVKRVGGATRLDTSLYLAINYWRDCKSLVLVDGFNSSYYLAALSLAVERKAPIIYTKNGKPPDGFRESLENHLKDLKSIIVVGESLDPNEANFLRSKGYSVSYISSTNVTLRYPEGIQLISGEIAAPLLAIFSFPLGSLLTYVLMRRSKREEGSLMDFLTLDERKLVEIIKEKGEVLQEELSELTGFSKPKISRMIAELSDRRILSKEKYGKTYIIRLNERARNL